MFVGENLGAPVHSSYRDDQDWDDQFAAGLRAANTDGADWVYPDTGRFGGGAHHNLAYALSDHLKARGAFKPEHGGWDALWSELEETEGCVVLSSEAFAKLSADEVADLARILEGHHVQIHLCLRRHDGRLHSSYLQRAKFGRITFDPDLDILLGWLQDDWERPTFEHATIYRSWVVCFGASSIVVTDYDRLTAGLVPHFWAAHGLAPVQVPDLPRANTAPTLRSLVAVWYLKECAQQQLGHDVVISAHIAAKISGLYRDRPDVVPAYKLFGYGTACAIWDEMAQDRAALVDLLGPGVVVPRAPLRSDYAQAITDPKALLAQMSADDRREIDSICRHVVRGHRRAKAG
ncbi:hypothetical protein JANAI62_15350 [Jannaschia pagri]|uniref:Uncharacterized protein n=1 Tax=Jannaschia pagri TaxID=2829797 RepID=A0ABQ4NKG2_9RHOB|nr:MULTISPECIES: hypothetical protein [unclassified Jannaschia]GIT91080.1 hypothetical protein JANAI61_15380 [Jannaschia sp. AI_61]GIT94912.1 hypothetical protein JANAI62_15350 [Jannaschia sp. AI_62]